MAKPGTCQYETIELCICLHTTQAHISNLIPLISGNALAPCKREEFDSPSQTSFFDWALVNLWTCKSFKKYSVASICEMEKCSIAYHRTMDFEGISDRRNPRFCQVKRFYIVPITAFKRMLSNLVEWQRGPESNPVGHLLMGAIALSVHVAKLCDRAR